MAASSTLCEYCRKIPFFAPNPPADGTEWELGSVDEIRNQLGCPLCCIIIAGLDQRLRSSFIFETERITLMWNQDRGKFSVKRRLYVERYECDLCFMSGFTPSAWQLERQQNFMAISALQRYIDYPRIRMLLQACIDDHGDFCNPESSSALPSTLPVSLKTFRLIDVHDRCIVERQSFCRYLALSYVWGGVTNARLTTNNKATLLTPGALRNYWNYLPRTIQDAIILTEKLGERYVWVDSICLLQNDPLDLRLGIDVMDIIYERAIMTIVAASGENAHSSLPGVFGAYRDPYPRAGEISRTIKLVMYFCPDDLMRNTSYGRRAWTFQEQLVSSRTLTFIDGRWVFRCKTNAWSEDLPSSIDKHLLGYRDLSIGGAGPQFLLEELLCDYTSRLLTNQDDALNAIRGILRRLSPVLGNSLIEGLPAAAFDFFVPFMIMRSSFRRNGFPSYSWTGWIGGISYLIRSPKANFHLNNWLTKGTWIIWYTRSPSGVTKLLWGPEQNAEFLYRLNKTPQGIFGNSGWEPVIYSEKLPFETRHSLQNQTLQTTPTENIHIQSPRHQYQLLQFWTLTVQFTIADFMTMEHKASLLDNEQVICGALAMDGFEEDTFFTPNRQYEFILISECDWPDLFLVFIPTDYPLPSRPSAWRYYSVLVLQWNGNIAERRGYGVIHQASVERSLSPGPTWKEIILA